MMARLYGGNLGAFLDMIAVSELGEDLIALSDDGYNVLVGSTPKKPLLFYSYKDHPRILNEKMKSTAAGRYQILKRYFDPYKELLKLKDFSPEAQDAIAVKMIREQGAFDDASAGRFETAVNKVNDIWASLPGSPYGQHTNDIKDLRLAYISAGGRLV